MSVAARRLVGREDELRAVIDLLGVADRRSNVVVLVGEAGIGKTSLWLASVDAAAERGYRVLSCRASDAETQFSFGGLAPAYAMSLAEHDREALRDLLRERLPSGPHGTIALAARAWAVRGAVT